MSIPQFDPNHVAAHSYSEDHMYHAELSSRDPMSSVLADNPEIYFVPPKRKSEWGQWEFKPASYLTIKAIYFAAFGVAQLKQKNLRNAA